MNAGCFGPTGYEYFWQEEAIFDIVSNHSTDMVEALSLARTRAHGAKLSSFSLHGHRLSSLFRGCEGDPDQLNFRY